MIRPLPPYVFLTAAILAAGCNASVPAFAQNNASVQETAIGGVAPVSISITQNTPVVVKGRLAGDLHIGAGHQADTYGAGARPGHLSVASHLTADAKGNIDGAQTNVSAQFQDRLQVIGAPAGKNVILHKTIAILGGASFTKALTRPGSSIEVSSDLRITGGGAAIFAQAPYFPALDGNPADATSRHTDSNTAGLLPIDRDLFAPASLDYSILFTAGQDATVIFDLDLVSETFALGGGVASFTGGYDLNFDTGPGYFTLADVIGHDTGVRWAGPSLSIQSKSGFNFFAAAGEGGADMTAVPEPASWALMIVGLGLSGAMLRRRRAFLRQGDEATFLLPGMSS